MYRLGRWPPPVGPWTWGGLGGIALLVLAAPALFAQEIVPSTAPVGMDLPAPSALSTATLNCDFLEYRSTDNAVLARGHAVLLSSGTRMEADTLTLYLSSHVAEAQGHVYLEDRELAVLADGIGYNWEASTGVLQNIFIQEGPWRVWGRRMERLGPDLYRIERAAFTSCELNPPHFHFRGGSALFRVKKRVSVTHIRAAAENTPIFYLPYYTHSLGDHRWTYTVDPGNSARNGYFAKNVFTYPVGDHARAKLLWDYYSKAGNGFGAEFSYSTANARGSLSGYEIKDRIDETRRWNIRLAHWQQLNPRWQVQSHVAMQSDQDVNNEFIGDDVQRTRQLGESDLALTHAASWYTARVFTSHDRALDPTQNRYVTAKTILPQFGFQTNALKLGKSNAYFNFNGNFRNEYDRPEANPPNTDPIVPGKDSYRQFADGLGRLSWRLPLTKNLSLEPSAAISESWQSDQETATEFIPDDVTVGKGSTGLNLRQRVTPSLDFDLSHLYRVRWEPNTFTRDHSAADQGLEQNGLNFFASYRPSSALWGRASTFYDLRDTPSLGYHTPRQRFSPPSFEVGAKPRPWFSATARETVQLYPARKSQSTLFDFRLGPNEKAYFSTGFSYNVGRAGELDVNHGAAFQLTPGWWLSGDLHYTASGDGGIHYNKTEFKEKNLVVRRDLHCWVVRATYRERPGVNEIYFRLDLKTNMDLRKKQGVIDEKQFYPGRDTRGND